MTVTTRRDATVRVVDDEESLTDLVSSALRFAGYDVRTADNRSTRSACDDAKTAEREASRFEPEKCFWASPQTTGGLRGRRNGSAPLSRRDL